MLRTDAGARLSSNMAWVIVWVGLGLAVGLLVAATQGRDAATEYVAAYLLEESLSVDNIFVFVVIFSELHIPAEYERRVLVFGLVEENSPGRQSVGCQAVGVTPRAPGDDHSRYIRTCARDFEPRYPRDGRTSGLPA